MTNLARLMPHVLDQLRLEEDGWELKARLLGWIAVGTWEDEKPGDSAIRLGVPELVSKGLAEATARYVRHELLERIAVEHRAIVIERAGRGRSPRCYLAGAEPADAALHWRAMPWRTTRKSALGLFRARSSSALVGQVVVVAGQDVARWWSDHLPEGVTAPPTSVNAPPPGPRQPPPGPRKGPVTGGATTTWPTNPAPPHNASGVLRTQSVSSAVTEGQTDGRTEELRSLTKALAAVVHELTGHAITGEPWRRAEAIAGAHLDRPEQLIAHARTLTAWRTFGGLLGALEAWEPTPAPPPPVERCDYCVVPLTDPLAAACTRPQCPQRAEGAA